MQELVVAKNTVDSRLRIRFLTPLAVMLGVVGAVACGSAPAQTRENVETQASPLIAAAVAADIPTGGCEGTTITCHMPGGGAAVVTVPDPLPAGCTISNTDSLGSDEGCLTVTHADGTSCAVNTGGGWCGGIPTRPGDTVDHVVSVCQGNVMACANAAAAAQ